MLNNDDMDNIDTAKNQIIDFIEINDAETGEQIVKQRGNIESTEKGDNNEQHDA